MKKNSKFYRWCEKNKNKTWLKNLLTIIAWCYLLLTPIILLIIFIPIIGLIYFIIPDWLLVVIGIFWIVLSVLLGIIINAIFTNWVNKIYDNSKPCCLNNKLNQHELIPFDSNFADSNLDFEVEKMLANWQKRNKSNRKIDKFFNSTFGNWTVKLITMVIAAVFDFPYIYIFINFQPAVWIQIFIYIGLGIPLMTINFITLFMIFNFLFLPPKKYRKKHKKEKSNIMDDKVENKES